LLPFLAEDRFLLYHVHTAFANAAPRVRDLTDPLIFGDSFRIPGANRVCKALLKKKSPAIIKIFYLARKPLQNRTLAA
jgi:hypothetical protein